MYLKRVDASGFKSFAHKVNINFIGGINGIVGPNGCGKSNITDAIKWVLGEQSTKNLRASGMSDVIFAGSEAYHKQNVAEVTLVFDNMDRALKLDFNEVEITRRLYRSGESEYLINKTPSRLKDIVELIMDTGLGRDSLSMISQGAISNFAMAKPEERRSIFEEAAGVAKYKKRKVESLRKLEKTNENLVRIEDIIAELEGQVVPLKNQAIKAQRYLDKKEQLEKIEVSVIVSDIKKLDNEYQNFKSKMADIKQEMAINEGNQLIDDGKLVTLKNGIKTYDDKLATLQHQLLEQVDLISSLEIQKNEYMQRENANLQLDNTVVAKMEHTLNNLNIEIDGLNSNIQNFNNEIEDLKRQFEQEREAYNGLKENIVRKQSSLQNYLSRRDVLMNIRDNKSNVFSGVKAIIDNKNSLSGIVGMVGDLMKVDDQYQEAISKSLAATMQNVVVQSSDDAKTAISFLKNNKAGRATFMPIDAIQPKFIDDNHLYVARETPGFINVATDLVSYEQPYENIFKHLLNTTLIVDGIDSGIEISKLLKRKYRIVTLEGDIINSGGTLTGGKNKSDKGNALTLNADLQKADELIENLSNELTSLNDELYQKENALNHLRNQINQQQISVAKLEEASANKSHQFANLKTEYQQVTNKEYDTSDENAEFVNIHDRLNKANAMKQKVLMEIKTLRDSRMEMSRDLDALEQRHKETRIALAQLSQEYNQINLAVTKNEMATKNSLDRLADEYQLTIDNAYDQVVFDLDISLARDQVNQLKKEIKDLGVVNLLAIEEYQTVSKRFAFLNDQREDLSNARDEILDTINDTDKIVVEKFSKTIEDINDELPETFKKLFGGGHAQLEYTDPSNILETGIEIIASPPGKSIQNLNLFSGGEKALIALSVLFAIIKARPIPLCILDEVEAALDQANVERFAKFLKDFSNQTQFIVITHRPGTMEQCDILYGVTMQEKGVTKMVGVQFEEAKTLAQQK